MPPGISLDPVHSGRGHPLKIEAQIEKEIEQLLADAKKAESDHEELPVGLNFQKGIGRRKDLLTDIAEAKAKIELRAKGRDAHERAEYEEKMARHLAKAALKFGIIKSVMGFRQFSMRGLAAAQSEWDLVCLSWNLKRMAVMRLQ